MHTHRLVHALHCTTCLLGRRHPILALPACRHACRPLQASQAPDRQAVCTRRQVRPPLRIPGHAVPVFGTPPGSPPAPLAAVSLQTGGRKGAPCSLCACTGRPASGGSRLLGLLVVTPGWAPMSASRVLWTAVGPVLERFRTVSSEPESEVYQDCRETLDEEGSLLPSLGPAGSGPGLDPFLSFEPEAWAVKDLGDFTDPLDFTDRSDRTDEASTAPRGRRGRDPGPGGPDAPCCPRPCSRRCSAARPPHCCRRTTAGPWPARCPSGTAGGGGTSCTAPHGTASAWPPCSGGPLLCPQWRAVHCGRRRWCAGAQASRVRPARHPGGQGHAAARLWLLHVRALAQRAHAISAMARPLCTRRRCDLRHPIASLLSTRLLCRRVICISCTACVSAVRWLASMWLPMTLLPCCSQTSTSGGGTSGAWAWPGTTSSNGAALTGLLSAGRRTMRCRWTATFSQVCSPGPCLAQLHAGAAGRHAPAPCSLCNSEPAERWQMSQCAGTRVCDEQRYSECLQARAESATPLATRAWQAARSLRSGAWSCGALNDVWHSTQTVSQPQHACIA